MAKTKRRRRRSSSSHTSHRRRRRNRNPMLFGGHRPHRRRRRAVAMAPRRRRRNPGLNLKSIASGGTLELLGGAAAGFFGSRFGAQNIPGLSQYNTGVTGYLLNAGIGVGISAIAGKFFGRNAFLGGLAGTGLAIAMRMMTSAAPATPSGSTQMSGDLDFDLGYYVNDRFPFPQGNGGPYDAFPGTPYLPSGGPFPATSAAAVRAGASAAAAAALPATAVNPGMVTPAAALQKAGWASNWA